MNQPPAEQKDLSYWLQYYLNWYSKAYREFIPSKGLFWTSWPITAVAELLEHAAFELAINEPRIHSNLSTTLHKHHPLSKVNQVCKTCSCLVYNSRDMLNILPWVETGAGVYCLLHFRDALTDQGEIDSKFAIPVHTGPVDMGPIPPAIPIMTDEQKQAMSQAGELRVNAQAQSAFRNSRVSQCSDSEFEQLVEETRAMRRSIGVSKPAPTKNGWAKLFNLKK